MFDHERSGVANSLALRKPRNANLKSDHSSLFSSREYDDSSLSFDFSFVENIDGNRKTCAPCCSLRALNAFA